MPFIRKDKAGSCPGHVWEHDGDVVEIDDPQLVADLLAIPGFSEVAPPEAESPGGPDASQPVDEPAAPKRRTRSTTKTEVAE